jgi:hypothetical protein
LGDTPLVQLDGRKRTLAWHDDIHAVPEDLFQAL